MLIKIEKCKLFQAVQYGKTRELLYGFAVDHIKNKGIQMLFDYKAQILHIYDPNRDRWQLIYASNIESLEPDQEDYNNKMAEYVGGYIGDRISKKKTKKSKA